MLIYFYASGLVSVLPVRDNKESEVGKFDVWRWLAHTNSDLYSCITLGIQVSLNAKNQKSILY